MNGVQKPILYHNNRKLCFERRGQKETRHVVFALGDSGLDYKVGDALGVVPENPPHIVDELIEIQGWDRDSFVNTHYGERTLYEALMKYF